MTIPHLFERTEYLQASTSAGHLAMIAEQAIEHAGLLIKKNDPRKPWGIEIKLRGNHERAMKFLEHFFGDLPIAKTLVDPVTPKILLIADGNRLSWHVHERKDAHLRVLHGHVGVSLSATDEEPAPRLRFPGAYVHVPPFMRHRLSSVSGWAVVAEIGRDVVPDRPSDDQDTRRIKDDYGR